MHSHWSSYDDGRLSLIISYLDPTVFFNVVISRVILTLLFQIICMKPTYQSHFPSKSILHKHLTCHFRWHKIEWNSRWATDTANLSNIIYLCLIFLRIDVHSVYKEILNLIVDHILEYWHMMAKRKCLNNQPSVVMIMVLIDNIVLHPSVKCVTFFKDKQFLLH